MMNCLRSFAVSFLALLAFVPASAQGNDSFVRRVLDRILAPSLELDPAAVYQPEPRWTIAITGDMRQAGMSQNYYFDMAALTPDGEGKYIIEKIPTSISSRLAGGVIGGIGFQAGLGGLSVSLSKKFKGEGVNNTLSFDYMSAGYAFQLQYFKFSDLVKYDFVMGEPGNPHYQEFSGYTINPGQMRALILDTFYAFNRRTFAYSAAYRGSVIQRRSAGSWMFGSKLILGDYGLDPSEDVALWAGGQAKQTSTQVSFGGGYSYNFVPFHRQPYGDREKGLRNLTINVTFLPMVTMFNQFTSTEYAYTDVGVYTPSKKNVMNGNLLVNYVARAGVGYTWDLNTVNINASYDSYAYKGNATLNYETVVSSSVKTTGDFQRWTVNLRFCRHF